MQKYMQYSQQPQNVQQQSQQMGDMIENLPADNSVLSHNEIRIVDQLFQKKKGLFDRILSNTKDILIIGALFVLFSIPHVDNIIKKFVAVSNNSQYILLGVKAVLFMITYFIVKNMYLVRKINVK